MGKYKKRKAVKRVLVEKYIKANPKTTMTSVARVTGVALNYIHKINRDLKETEAHARMASDMATPSIDAQVGEIYERMGGNLPINAVREHVRKLEEQDQAKQSSAGRLDLDRGTLTVPWRTFTINDNDAAPTIGEAVSDGSTASYYELPGKCTQLQHLISYKDMNAQIGEIFRSCYRYGESSHSTKLRDAKKIKFYIDAEITRLEA